MAKLITTSLLGSIDWYNQAYPAMKQSAYKQLSDQLNRVFTSSPAIEYGQAFERRVELDVHKLKHIEGHKLTGSDNYVEIVNAVKEGNFQRKIKKIVNLDSTDYCLYGKIDVDLPELIVDLKTTGSYKKDKYLKTTQHLMYCVITGKTKFKYIVAEWAKYPQIKQVHYETYNMPSLEIAQDKLYAKIRAAIAFINSDDKLKEAYNTTFCMYS